MTWSADIRPTNRKKAVITVLAVIFIGVLVLAAVVVLYFENVVFTTGPSRKDVSHTAERIINSDIADMPGRPSLGHPSPYYRPCGHGELPPLEAWAGVDTRFSGIPAKQHAAFEKELDARTSQDINALPADQAWKEFVMWDSPKSDSGVIEVGMGCAPVARWPEG